MCFDARRVQLKTQNMRLLAAFVMPEPSASSGRSGFLCSGVQPGDQFPASTFSGSADVVCPRVQRGHCLTVNPGRSEPGGSTNRRPDGNLCGSATRKVVSGCGMDFIYACGVTSEGVITLVTTERRKWFKSLRTKGLAWVDQASTGKLSSDDADNLLFPRCGYVPAGQCWPAVVIP